MAAMLWKWKPGGGGLVAQLFGYGLASDEVHTRRVPAEKWPMAGRRTGARSKRAMRISDAG